MGEGGRQPHLGGGGRVPTPDAPMFCKFLIFRILHLRNLTQTNISYLPTMGVISHLSIPRVWELRYQVI